MQNRDLQHRLVDAALPIDEASGRSGQQVRRRLLDSVQHLEEDAPARAWQLFSGDCRELAQSCSGMQAVRRGLDWCAAVPAACLCLQHC